MKRRQTCESAWASALKECRQTLGEDDFELVTDFKSVEDLNEELRRLESQYSNHVITRSLVRFRPHLDGFNKFTFFMTCFLGPSNINLAVTWGTITLLLKLACESERALSDVTKLLSDISQSLKLFEIYSEKMELEADMVRALFDILVDLVLTSVNAIKFFRKKGLETTATLLPWNNVCEGFRNALSEIRSRTEHLKQIAEARSITNLHSKSDDNQLLFQKLSAFQAQWPASAEESQITLPCHTLPFQRNPNFCGRRDILDKVTASLKESGDKKTIRSVALFGTGGVGKSQVALEYASRQIEAGLRIVIWVACEKEAQMLQSFNEAARMLNVPGFNASGSAELNRQALLAFLQRTGHPWLLIFDNVEQTKLLAQNWPKLGHGTIVATCRSELIAASPAASTLEIPTFTEQDGAEIFLKVLAKDNPTEMDLKYGKEISKKLGGLALALELMAQQARIRKKPLDQFLALYETKRKALSKSPRRGIHNPYYDKDLRTVWKASFENLSEEALSLMSLLAFAAPDDIPLTLFSRGGAEEDVSQRFEWPDMEFLDDSDLLDEVLIELQDNSLIKANSETSLLSIHRLIQLASWDELDTETRRQSFYCMLSLLNQHFPTKNAAGHMWDKHRTCQQLVQHVLALVGRYLEMRNMGIIDRVENFTVLLCSAAWYLHECCLLSESQKVLDAALLNCPDNTTLEHAMIIDGSGALATEFAHYTRAKECFEQLLTIAKTNPDASATDLSYAYSALSYMLPGLWRNADAIKTGLKSLEYFQGLSVEEARVYHPDRLERNCGRAYFLDGYLEEAESHFRKAEEWATHLFGLNSYYHGEAYYSLARIEMQREKYEKARELFRRSRHLLCEVNPVSSAVGAILFYEGRMAMAERDHSLALKIFQDCLKICEVNAVKGNKGEKARLLWYMAKAYEMEKKLPEAGQARREAMLIRDAMYGSGVLCKPPLETEDNVWDGLVGMLYR